MRTLVLLAALLALGCPAPQAGVKAPPAEEWVRPARQLKEGDTVTVSGVLVSCGPTADDFLADVSGKPLAVREAMVMLEDDPRKPKEARTEYTCTLVPGHPFPLATAPVGSWVNVTGTVTLLAGNQVVLTRCTLAR